MARNTKEIALIQIRSGKLAQIPEALNQSEFGLAYDANRLFIGNPANPQLANRETFPYKNLELLTEFSDLKQYYKYSYQNNIETIPGTELPRVKLREYLPIVVTCGSYTVPTAANVSIKINNHSISIPQNASIYDTVNAINAEYEDTRTYATVIQSNLQNPAITFVCLDNDLTIEDTVGFLNFTKPSEYNIAMPERKVDEKLDDNLHITDFAIKGDGTIVSNEIFNVLSEVYRKYEDNQYYRDVFFPAGEYAYAQEQGNNPNDSVMLETSFPLLSNMYVKGEGIDRTVIKASGFANVPLLDSVDGSLVSSSSSVSSYGQGGYPNNIVIKDMTFDSASSVYLAKLVSTSNVTFENVKFIGGGNATTSLIYINGTENDKANNITFKNCQFDSAKTAITIGANSKNINIFECSFSNMTDYAIKVGNDVNALEVLGVNIDNNTFTNTTGDYVIWLGKSAQYVSIHQSIFDKEVIEQTGNTKPYRDFEANDRKNFCDTLDITTDEKKLLKFHFAQPEWQYINYLVNPDDGKTIFTVNGKNLIDAANGIDISLDGSDINITEKNEGNVSLNVANESNLVLGQTNNNEMIWMPETEYSEDDRIFWCGYIWTCTENHISGQQFDETYWSKGSEASEIILKRVLQLNGNRISNRTGNNDIVIETAKDKVIEVDDSDNTVGTNYEDLIVDNDKALVNVAYVKRMIRDSYVKHITFEDMVNYQPTEESALELPLEIFDRTRFGDDVHITKVTVNVRNPFYKLYENLPNAVDYVNGYDYYQGDVVKGTGTGGTKYAVVLKNHTATGNNIVGNDNLEVIDYQPTYEDIKFIDVIGYDKDGAENYLTRTYSEDMDIDLTKVSIEAPNIQANNRFGYNKVNELDLTKKYGGIDELVQYNDINYIIKEIFDEDLIWQPNTSYEQGDEVYYNGYMWTANSNFTSGSTFNPSNWTQGEPAQEPGPRLFSPTDLHNSEYASRKYDEGYCYAYDEDKNFNTMIFYDNSVSLNDKQNPYSKNYAGGSLVLKFYDKNMTEMRRFDDTEIDEHEQEQIITPKNLFADSQLNPAGDLVIRVDYVRQEV